MDRSSSATASLIASLLIAFLNYVLGLVGVQSMTKKMIIGIILIIAVAISRLNTSGIRRKRRTASAKA